MWFDLARVAENIRKSETEDLLNRATIYRADMEPAALDLIEQELAQRGLGRDQVREYAERIGAETIVSDKGYVERCRFCDRPAVAVGWGWYRILRTIPVVPRRLYFCRIHQPGQPAEPVVDEVAE